MRCLQKRGERAMKIDEDRKECDHSSEGVGIYNSWTRARNNRDGTTIANLYMLYSLAAICSRWP